MDQNGADIDIVEVVQRTHVSLDTVTRVAEVDLLHQGTTPSVMA